jgi:purine-nucleoside phosphorylase
MNNEKFFEFCFGCSPALFSETVILTPFLPLDRFKKHGNVRASFKGKVYSGIIVCRDGRDITIVRCGLGDRLTGDAILLMKNTGAKKIIFTGTCGGLKDCRIGNLIVCENAFNGEGFSRYYAESAGLENVLNTGEMVNADIEYTGALKNFIQEKISDKYALKCGNMFTIGSLLAENKENLMNIEGKGFTGIDLELSAVFHAARTIGRKAVGLLFVSDLPLKRPLGEKLTAQEKKDYQDGLDQVVRLSMEFA